MGKLFVLIFSLVTIMAGAHCGGMLNPCVDVSCPEGQLCVDNDGVAECQVPSNGGGGSGEEGDACESDADCMTGLTCSAGINGVLTCMI